MIIRIPKSPKKELPNYLIEYYSKNESYKGSLSLNNIHDILKNIKEEIESVKKIKNIDFDFSNRSIAYWINDERNISVRNLFVLLNKWKSICNIFTKAYNQLLDDLYNKASSYGYNGSESKSLIKYITPREAYIFGYHLGDGYLNSENLISYSDASINQLHFINFLFNDRFVETKRRVYMFPSKYNKKVEGP
ncbi:MAG: hypothetical protein KJ906_02340 [Nanoarchaeota archaeon]|nr:hypothetical protein [Nanoarchaeota archaeon]